MAQLTKIDGRKIRKRREDLLLSVKRAAELIGCHPDTLRNIQLGHRQPSIELLARILDVLEADIDDFRLDARPRVKAGR